MTPERKVTQYMSLKQTDRTPQEAARPGFSAHTAHLALTPGFPQHHTPVKKDILERLAVCQLQPGTGRPQHIPEEGWIFLQKAFGSIFQEKSPEVRCVWKTKIEADLAWKPCNTPGNVVCVYTGVFPA